VRTPPPVQDGGVSTPQPVDVLVVGGGSAGCVLAARLSEDPAREVLLVESGPLHTDDWPAELLDAGVIPARHIETWQYTSALTAHRTGHVSRGRVVGGSGAVNGGYFVRATPTDLDGWGVPGFSYAELLPAFVRSETDADLDGPLHGRHGPMPVQRRARLHPLSATFTEACRAAGFAEEADKNSGGAPGIGRLPLNVRNGVRVNAAMAYLLPALGRPNLTVRAETTVVRVLVEDERATGVELAGGEMVRAGQVVLSAGALASAHLLLLSGIGPAAQLRSHGLAVHTDLPVGQGFSDHPDVAVPYTPVEHAPRPAGTPALEVALNTPTLELRPYTAPFAELVVGSGGGPRPSLGVALVRPDSRGELRLRSAEPLAPPELAHHYLETARDRTALREGVRLAYELLRLPDADDQELDRMVAANLGTSMHTVGTCALGDVVDEQFRVHGVAGLRVVDASVVPVVPSRGPHATVIALAEHAAARWADDIS
jgi:choline dehydrogenase